MLRDSVDGLTSMVRRERGAEVGFSPDTRAQVGGERRSASSTAAETRWRYSAIRRSEPSFST